MTRTITTEKLLAFWRQRALHSSGWRSALHSLLADELENELTTANRRRDVLGVARDWEQYARELRASDRASRELPRMLREQLIAPRPATYVRHRAKVFEDAALRLQQTVLADDRHAHSGRSRG